MEKRVFLTNGVKTILHCHAKKKMNLDTDLTPTQKLTQKAHGPKCKQNKWKTIKLLEDNWNKARWLWVCQTL